MSKETISMMVTKQESRFIEFFRNKIPFGNATFTVNVVDGQPLKVIVKNVDAEKHFNLNFNLTE